MHYRIHILGASGSGTTTLASNLSQQLQLKHLDTDEYYWVKTKVPFTEKNPVETRLEMIREEIKDQDSWVLSGSICSWGEPLIEHFTHIIYLWVPWEIRKERLQKRELERYGSEALSPGGVMHRINQEFMEWASKYDTGGLEQRSRLTHDHWIDALPDHIQVIRVEEEISPSALTRRVITEIG